MHLISYKAQKGVGLIEVLVTILVLAVGLLGIAALQNSALRFNHTALLESQAQFLVKDIVDSMRLVGKPDLFIINYGEAAPAASTNCKTTNCSSAQAVANWSMQQWMTNVTSLLPNSQVQIRRLDASTNEYSVTIRYDDLRGEVPPPGATYSVAKREVSVVTRI